MFQQIFNTDQYIHYGATINIRYSQGSDHKYICSDGISIKNMVTLSNLDYLVDTSSSLFVILPPIKFQFEKQMKKVLKERYGKQQKVKMDEKNTIDIIDEFEFELTENNELIQKTKNSPIKYGQAFILQHLHSCKYLNYCKVTENSNQYFLELCEIPNQNSYFIFQPCYNYQDQISNFIEFDSLLYITMKIQNQLEIRQAFINFIKGNILQEWQVSFQSKSPLKIGLFKNGEQQSNQYIQYGQPLWIFHLQTNSFLKYQNEDMEIQSFYLKKIKFALNLQFSKERDYNNENQKIYLEKAKNQTAAQKIGLWKIEAINRFKGGRIKFDHEIRLFNIRYKAYLCVKQYKTKKQIVYKISTEKYPSESTQFKIKSLSTNSNFITTSDLIIFEHTLTNMFISVNLNIQNLNQQTFQINPIPNFKNQDNFRFNKASFMSNWQNNFVLSILPFLQEGSNTLSKANLTKLKKKQESFLIFLRESLVQVLNFSYDLSECFQISENKIGKVSFNHFMIQKLLRQQGFLNKITKLLSRINIALLVNRNKKYQQNYCISGVNKILNDFLTQNNLNQSEITLNIQLIESIVRLCFKILRNATKSNNQSSLIILEKLDIFINFLGLQIGAEEFLIDFFYNNEQLLNSELIDFDLIISQYLNLKSNNNDLFFPEMFELLTVFLKNQDEGVNNNQMKLFNIMIQNKNNQSLLFPIFNNSAQLYIYFKTKIQLSKFIQDYSQNQIIIKSLINQIKFFAFLTYGRNYVCSKYVKQIFRFQCLQNYLNSDINQALKSSLVLIMIHAYLDERPRFKQSFPNLIYTFKETHISTRMTHEYSSFYKENSQIKEIKKSEKVIELTKLKSFNIGQQTIKQLLDCISLKDSLSLNEIKFLKKWIIQTLQNFIDNPNIEQFYNILNNSCLTCLKIMIELSIFNDNQSKNIQKIVFEIIKKLKQALKQNSQPQALSSENFNQILSEMLVKNILKKYNNKNNFDGIQDQITINNISLRFVKYAYYQNLFLHKKKKVEKFNLINQVLNLIRNYNNVRLDDKLKGLVQSVRDESLRKIDSEKEIKDKYIEKQIVGRILVQNQKNAGQKLQMIQSLLLMFYESNKFEINKKSLNQVLSLIFQQQKFINYLQQIVIIIDQDQQKIFDKLKNTYFNIKLLVETSQVWFSQDYSKPNYIYTPVINYFTDKLTLMINLLIDDQQKIQDILYLYRQNKALNKLSIQRQIMLMNIKLNDQLMTFLNMNIQMYSKITQRNPNNAAVIRMFQSCFYLLYIYIYNCKQTKQTMKIHYSNILNLIKIGKIQMGQTNILSEYLKDNYEQILTFCQDHLEQMMNKIIVDNNYSHATISIIKIIMSYYNEPIKQAIKKIFSIIFNLYNFRRFMFTSENKLRKPQFGKYIFQLNRNLINNEFTDPYLYQIESIHIVISVIQNLQESKNTFKTHIRATFTYEYIYFLLNKRDFFSDESSMSPNIKLNLMLKIKLLKLVSIIYLSDEQQPNFYEQLKKFLVGQSILFQKFIKQFNIRKETPDFRKVVIDKNRNQQNSYRLKYQQKLKSLYNTQLNYYSQWKKAISQFCYQINKHKSNQNIVKNAFVYTQQLLANINKLNQMMHQKQQTKITQVQMPLRWFIQEKKYQKYDSQRLRNQSSSIILQIVVNPNIFKCIAINQERIIQKLQGQLKELGITSFDFLRKISEFLQDLFQQLEQDQQNEENVELIINLIKLLKIRLSVGSVKQQISYKLQLGKSEILFPILRYFELCKLNKNNKKIFKFVIDFFNELIGEQGNPIIQNIFYQYFSKKTQSIQIFLKIKKILNQIFFQKQAEFKSKMIISSYYQIKNQVRNLEGQQEILLNFFISLCKANHKKNQLFLTNLRKISSFDVIKLILEILRSQTNEEEGMPLINKQNYKIIKQSFLAIRELVEGPCQQNQNQFLSSSFFEISLKYFRYQFIQKKLQVKKSEYKDQAQMLPQFIEHKLSLIDKCSQLVNQKMKTVLNHQYQVEQWMVSQIKYKCISTIVSLFEENVSEQAINKLVKSIPSSEIIVNIQMTYKKFIQRKLKYDLDSLEINDDKELILPLGFKLYFILNYYKQQDLETELNESLKFYQQHTRKIQVVHTNLFTLQFPMSPIPISASFKKQFILKVDRTSINSKLKQLQQAQIQNRRSDYGFFLSIIVFSINILDLFIYHDTELDYIGDFQLYPRFYGYEDTVDEVIQIFFHSLGLVCSFSLLLYDWTGAIYMHNSLKQIQNQQSFVQRIKKTYTLLSENLSYFYYLMTTIIFLLGLLNPFFDSILLIIQLFKRNQTFFEIGKALKQSFVQLLVVILIYFIANYLLLLFAYFFYSAAYGCTHSFHTCIVYGFDSALKLDQGVLSEATTQDDFLSNFSTKYTIQRVIYDLIYLFIIKLIIAQLIGAIIVDKFASIREQNENREIDQETKCFICGLDIELLDRQQNGFQKHKQQYHNVWNYFEFLLYLKNSKMKNLSGIELYIKRCQNQRNLKWFPINRSLNLEIKRNEIEKNLAVDLKDQEKNEQKIIENDLQILKKSLDQITQLINIKLFQKQLQQ